MNERIKELVKQAGFFVLSNGKIYIPTTSEEITDCQIKFANLIVQECAELARQHNLEHAERSHMIHKAIKEYFGVTE